MTTARARTVDKPPPSSSPSLVNRFSSSGVTHCDFLLPYLLLLYELDKLALSAGELWGDDIDADVNVADDDEEKSTTFRFIVYRLIYQ